MNVYTLIYLQLPVELLNQGRRGRVAQNSAEKLPGKAAHETLEIAMLFNCDLNFPLSIWCKTFKRKERNILQTQAPTQMDCVSLKHS